MKKILLNLLLVIAAHANATETQLFSNFQNPLFEANRNFITQVHERFEFDSSMLDLFVEQTTGSIFNSFVAESACVDKLGGIAVLVTELIESKKYDAQLKQFFTSSDGPRKAREFSGILLGGLREKERAELLSLPNNSRLVNGIVSRHFTSAMLVTHESAFKHAAAFFFNVNCPR